jgi:(S)-2-hydroxyglutarate dehydrogenase
MAEAPSISSASVGRRWDVAVVGGGVVGCATARALALRGERVVVLEKEARLAAHQSGRNSGVVHAGVTYRPGSLRARLAVEGGRRLRAFAREHKVPLAEVGKVWVAKDASEVGALERLKAQGTTNGVRDLRILDQAELRAVEPHAAGEAALHSPHSAIVDGGALVEALAGHARELGAEVLTRAPVRRVERTGARWRLHTPVGTVEADQLVTCAGLQSDRVARLCGADHPYRIVPFRGQFARLRPGREGLVRGMIYPVPDPRFPFVGIHFTKRTDGGVLVGPTALLALGREAYRHWLQVQPMDLGSMLSFPGFWRLFGRTEVRAQARKELRTALSLAAFVKDAQALIPDAHPEDFMPSPPGIRAQMVDREGRLVDDLVLLERDGAIHVLNAVSPGLTSSLALAEDIAAKVR